MPSITDGNMEMLHLSRVTAVTVPERRNHFVRRHVDSFLYVMSGGCELCMDDGRVLVAKPGDVYYIPLHSVYTQHVHPGGCSYIICDFACIGESPRQFFSFHPERPQKYEALFQKLLTNYASDEPFSKASCYSLLYQIYEQIVHDQNTAYLTEAARQIIEAARSFVLANLSDPSLSVAQVARHAQISEGHLRRLFHQKYGISPMKYIVEARMKKAKALLELEGIQICDVARQVGYSSSAYFCSIFHSMTGITPARYRQMYL